MGITYLYGDINFISVYDGYVKLYYSDKEYHYQLESNEHFYNVVYRNSYPLYTIVRKVKLSLLSELKQYQIKEIENEKILGI